MITQSVMEVFISIKKSNVSYRAVAIMRHELGGHPYGESDYLAKERETSRIHKL